MVNAFVDVADHSCGARTVSISGTGMPDNAATRFVRDRVVPAVQALLLRAFGVPARWLKEYTALLADLVHFIWLQALSVPNGVHGYFTRYRIDSITIGMSNFSYRAPTTTKQRVHQQDVATETVALLRSLNNLLTHMHRSFYLYLLSGPRLYTSVLEFSAIIALLVGGMLFLACAHFATRKPSVSGTLLACAEVLWFHGVGVVLGVCAHLLLPAQPERFAAVFTGLSLVAVLCPVLLQRRYGSASRRADSADAFVAVSLVPCLVYLGGTYLTNFSFCALAAAVLVVPALLHCRLPRRPVLLRLVAALAYSVPVLVVAAAACTGETWQQLVVRVFTESQHVGARLAGFLLYFYHPFALASLRLAFAQPPQPAAAAEAEDKLKTE